MTPSLGTSICHRCGPRKSKKKKKRSEIETNRCKALHYLVLTLMFPALRCSLCELHRVSRSEGPRDLLVLSFLSRPLPRIQHTTEHVLVGDVKQRHAPGVGRRYGIIRGRRVTSQIQSDDKRQHWPPWGVEIGKNLNNYHHYHHHIH